jgi:heparosan-N-sulfate-glucuronate 5-epimerase
MLLGLLLWWGNQVVVPLVVAKVRAARDIPAHYADTPAVDASRECLPSPLMDSGEHYRDFLGTARRRLDTDGIIMHNYGRAYEEAGWQKTPLYASRFGMAGLRAWCGDGDAVGFNIAVRHAEWLVESAVTRGKFVVWRYRFPSPDFGVRGDWASGLGNAFSHTFLTQMYHVTGDQRFYDTAVDSVAAYNVNMDGGGLRAYMYDGESVFFEEVAYPGIRPSHILNGHLFALEGLAYVSDYLDQPEALRLFEGGSQAVAKYAARYDIDGASL